MTKKTTNIFESAVAEREKKQARLAAEVTGTVRPVGRPLGEPKTKITLSITQEDSDTIKMYAIKQHKTVSDIFAEWIAEKCVD